jgi:NitT/TauT family transport system substrate-binding protein
MAALPGNNFRIDEIANQGVGNSPRRTLLYRTQADEECFMRRNRAIVFTGAAIVILAIVAVRLLWPPPPPPPPPRLPLTIAVPTYLGYEALYYAAAKHAWEKAGLEITLRHIDEVQMIAAGLSQNTINGTLTTVDAAVQARAQLLPARIVLVTDRSTGADGIVAAHRCSCKSIPDLAGRSVGLQLGTASHYYILTRLRQEHLTTRDVKLVPLEPDQIPAAVLSNNVDAAVTWQPFLAELSARPEVVTIETTRKSPVALLDVLFVTEASLGHDHDAWSRFVTTWFAVLNDIRRDPKQFYAFVAAKYRYSVNQVEQLYSGIAFLDRDANVFYFTDKGATSLAATIDDVSTVFRSADVIPRNVAVDMLLDNRLVVPHDK